MLEQIKEYKDSMKKKAEQQNADNLRDIMKLHEKNTNPVDSVSPEEDPDIVMLRQLLKALRRSLGSKSFMYSDDIPQGQSVNGILKSYRAGSSYIEQSGFRTADASVATADSGRLTTMKRTTVTSGFFAETEVTAYVADGVARTADGREISFGVTLEMSRGFSQHYESLLEEEVTLCDPLVINLDSSVAAVSDMRFMFDIDADGKEEEISSLKEGSGYLALDRNGDGRINDGSELFGTKSQNGFADLAKYDEDGNGWIDEADSIFRDLRVWTKDNDGKDVLLDLKSADVGAIYLGNSSTEFSLKDTETNSTNAVIRSTGIYLKESGGAGTLQHVDMAV